MRKRRSGRVALIGLLVGACGYLAFQGYTYLGEYWAIKSTESAETRDQFRARFAGIDETWTEERITARAGQPLSVVDSRGERTLRYLWERIDRVSWDLTVVAGASETYVFTFQDGK